MRRPRAAWNQWVPAAAAASAVLAVCGYPLARLFAESLFDSGGFSLRPYAGLFEGATAIAIENTLVVALVAATAALIAGGTAALLVQRSDLPGRRILGLLLLLPLLTPPFIQAVAWLAAYARGGLTFHWWGLSAQWLQGPLGVAVLLAAQAFPLVYLLIGAQLATDRGAELEEAARTAGAGQWRALTAITLPRLAPAIVAAALIALVSAASDFGVPAALGIPAGFTVVTTLIYRRLSLAGGSDAFAAVITLSALLALVALFAIVAATLLNSSAMAAPAGTRRAGTAGRLRLGIFRWPITLIAWVALLGAAVLPLLALFLQSVAPAFTPSISPASWSSAHFDVALSRGGLLALGHSVALAAAAGCVVAAGGAAVAASCRRRGWIGQAAIGVASLPFALPGSVVAIAAILAWQRWLYGTFAIILLAYVARFAIFGVRAAGAGLAALPEELCEAARVSGASPWRVALHVQRPLIQPALLAAFALTFLLAVHELTISSLLYTPSTETMSVLVLSSQQAGDVAVTAALAMVVLAVTFAAALPLALSGRVRRLIGAEVGG